MKRKQVPIKKEPGQDWTSLFTMPELETTATAEDEMEATPSAPAQADKEARDRAQTLSAASSLFVDVFAKPSREPVHKKHKGTRRDDTEQETEDYLKRKQITTQAPSELVGTAPDAEGSIGEPRPEPLSYEAKRLFAAMRNPEGGYYKQSSTGAASETNKPGKKPGTAAQSASAKSKAAALLLASAAGHDSDTQDGKLTHRILRDGEKEKIRFQSKLRRKNIDPCPVDAIPEEQRDMAELSADALIRPDPETGLVPEHPPEVPAPEVMEPPDEDHAAPILRADGGVPASLGLLPGMDVNMFVPATSANRKPENLDGLTQAQLQGIVRDLDRPMSTRQAADGLLPPLHQQFYYPHDENKKNGDPPELRKDRPRQGQHGNEYFSGLEAERRARDAAAAAEFEGLEREHLAKEAADAREAAQQDKKKEKKREAEGRRLQKSVEDRFDMLVQRYRTESLDMSRIFSFLEQGVRNVFVHEGSESVLLRKLAAVEPQDRFSDDSWLRQARPGEPECMKGLECEGRKIPGTVPVVNLARFTEKDLRDLPPGQTWPTNISRACVMCRRYSVAYYFLQNRSARTHMPPNVAITDFCNLPDDRGQYALEQCLMNPSSDPNQLLPVPVVLHSRRWYRQVHDPDGYYSWKQDGYYMPTADTSILHLEPSAPPSQALRDF